MSKFWSEAVKRTEPYVPGEQLNEKNLIKLNTNENPYPPSPTVIEAIQTEANTALQLYPSPTVDELREEIASYYNVRKENVFVGNGSDEVLAFAFMAFFNPGKTIRYPDITYSFYPVYSKLFDIPYETMPLQDDFTIRPEDYYQSEGGVLFPNPNAPTGIYLGLSAIEAILQENEDNVVIVDEAYVDFADQSAVTLLANHPNLLVTQTMSKSRALAGLRVGFAIGSEHLIEALVRIKDSINSYTVDRLAIAGATAAMKDVDYFNETTEKIIRTREWVNEELIKRGFDVLPSQTNFLFATHREKSAQALYEGLKAKKVLIRYFDTEPIDKYIRITIGTNEEMEKFFTALDTL